jgi:hypothetical protein
MDRTTEHLGATDVGLIMFRRLLDQQMKIEEDGDEPMNIQRDSAKNEVHVFPVERFEYPAYGWPFHQRHPTEAGRGSAAFRRKLVSRAPVLRLLRTTGKLVSRCYTFATRV